MTVVTIYATVYFFVIEKVITLCYISIGMLYTVERCENDRDKKEYYADAAF